MALLRILVLSDNLLLPSISPAHATTQVLYLLVVCPCVAISHYFVVDVQGFFFSSSIPVALCSSEIISLIKKLQK